MVETEVVVYHLLIYDLSSLSKYACPLVKIDHMIFIYVTTPHSQFSAVLAITHENSALLVQ